VNKQQLRFVALTVGFAAAVAVTAVSFAPQAAADTLVMAIQGTPASIDGEQALTSEGEMMMANVHGGDLFGYKVLKGRGNADGVDQR
jgi:hypothetical protein